MTPVQFRKFMKSLNSARSSHVEYNSYKFKAEDIFPTLLMEHLQSDSMLKRTTRTRIIHLIADDLNENLSTVQAHFVQRVAESLVAKFGRALGCITADDGEAREAAVILYTSILNRVEYLRRKRKDISNDSDCDPDDPPTPAVKRFTKSQSYGLDPARDTPAIREGDDPITVQESSRAVLEKMKKKGDINWTLVCQIMKKTYIALRSDINNSTIDMAGLIQRWPFIGYHSVLEDHFYDLMPTVKPEDVSERCRTVVPKIIDFFVYLSRKDRRGGKKDIPKELNKVIKDNASLSPNGCANLVANIMCMLKHLSVPFEKVFLSFSDTTSFDEVQTSAMLPKDGKPVLAVLGEELLLNPKTYVLVDNRIISSTTVSLSRGIHMLFMSYFVFKVAYDPDAAPIFEYLQRKIYKIEDTNGTRVQRRKSKEEKYGHCSPPISLKYNSFMKAYAEYRDTYLVNDRAPLVPLNEN